MCEHRRESFRKVSTCENFRKFSITSQEFGSQESGFWVAINHKQPPFCSTSKVVGFSFECLT
jgi:hypothetical protein